MMLKRKNKLKCNSNKQTIPIVGIVVMDFVAIFLSLESSQNCSTVCFGRSFSIDRQTYGNIKSPGEKWI